MCPHTSDRAIALWGKACNFHRGSDPNHLAATLGMQAGTRKGRGGRGDTLEIPEGVAMTTVGESHGGPSSDAGKTEAEGRTKLRGLSEDSISILIEKRHELESHIIDTFDEKKCGSKREGCNSRDPAHHDR